MQTLGDGNRASLLEARWLRWTVLAAFLALWLLVVYRYPVYFQRDDADMLVWSQQHAFWDCFRPVKEAALFHDSMFRPLRELGWFLQFKLFGLNAIPYHYVLGLLLIFTLAFLFKLVAVLTDHPTGYLAIIIWLGAFQFLLTNLFWFSDTPHMIEMLLICAGFYCLISGIYRASTRTKTIGIMLLAASAFAKEPAAIILPVAVAVYIVSVGPSRLKWNTGKVASFAALALLSGPVYFILFPFAFLRHPTAETSMVGGLVGAGIRINYYGAFLTSGPAGAILLISGIYYIIARLWRRRDPSTVNPAVILAIAACLTIVIMKTHLYSVGLGILLISLLLLPRSFYFLVCWALIPFVGLLFFGIVFRSYLYELSFALSFCTAIQASALLRDMVGWWKEHFKAPVLNYIAVGLVLVAVLAVGSAKLKNQTRLLSLRSDSTMSLESLTPHLKRLPVNSVLLVVDYHTMGLKWGDVMRLPDAQKLVYQGSMLPLHHAMNWMKLIGRSDITLATLGEFQSQPRERHPKSVFIWLMTPKDHEYVASLRLRYQPYASARRGDARMDLLELRQNLR